jgi:hypothetical protein
MICPHCRISFHDQSISVPLRKDIDGAWMLIWRECPTCKHSIINLEMGQDFYQDEARNTLLFQKLKNIMVWPKASSRPPCPVEVPKNFAEDYIEACLVFPDSAKASAALSRRCLQHILREVAKVKPGNLADEIQQVIDSGKLPSHLVESIDAIRNIGNFAAHPLKSQKTGEILPVEPGEAEWNLDVIEALFDFYFVQPEILKKKRYALDQKLKEAGKKPMK